VERSAAADGNGCNLKLSGRPRSSGVGGCHLVVARRVTAGMTDGESVDAVGGDGDEIRREREGFREVTNGK